MLLEVQDIRIANNTIPKRPLFQGSDVVTEHVGIRFDNEVYVKHNKKNSGDPRYTRSAPKMP